MSTSIGWNILHVELSQGIPDLTASQDGRGIYVVFWWRAVPVSDWYISSAALPMPQSAVAEYLASFSPNWDRIPAFGSTEWPVDLAVEVGTSRYNIGPGPGHSDSVHNPSEATSDDARADAGAISIVICTRDRPQQLDQCLRSLRTLSVAPGEIVVVDNASKTDETRLVVEAAPGVSYVHEPRPGLDIARNTGARSSKGDFVAYVDDDVQVHPDLLQGIMRGFHNPDVMAVTGLVLPAELETQAQVTFETHWTFNKGYSAKTFGQSFYDQYASSGVPVWEIGAGANMAFRRTVFDLVGYFDDRLDVGAAGCSGDSEFWYRVLAEGWKCQYEPSAVVFHTHRREMDGLKRQIYSYMRGATTAHLIQYEKYGNSGDLKRPLLTLPRWYLQLLAGRVRHGGSSRTSTWGSEVRGVISGFLYYVRNRQPPSDALAPPRPAMS